MAGARRWIYITHRWLGIVLCLFMALWFASGVVMMYVGYPKLTAGERLARLPDLRLPEACCISPRDAVAAAGRLPAPPASGDRRRPAPAEAPELRLAMIGAEPYWLVGEGRRQAAVHADTGQVVTGVDGMAAIAAAAAFSPAVAPRFVETVHQDIFTVSRALDGHRPLHRFTVDDEVGTEFYVSSRTGEVIRDSTAVERGWNYLGSILHWLYPLKGAFFDPLRPDIIIYLSLAGTVLAILGICVGLWRWRFSGCYGNGRSTPYRSRWMRWHHLSGLVFGLVTATWIFSGLLSMNPWKIFESGAIRPNPQVLAGTTLEQAVFRLSPGDAIAKAGFPVRELVPRLFRGEPYYLLYGASGRSVAIAASGGGEMMDMFPRADLEAAAQDLLPGYRPVRLTWLDGYDNYYYARRPHTMTGHVERRLPVLRVEYDDPDATWIHLDPHTGRIHSRIDSTGRVRRWLFAFLHSFDAQGFLDRRPLWDVTLILSSIGGFVLCLTGIVIGWRRLYRPRVRG